MPLAAAGEPVGVGTDEAVEVAVAVAVAVAVGEADADDEELGAAEGETPAPPPLPPHPAATRSATARKTYEACLVINTTIHTANDGPLRSLERLSYARESSRPFAGTGTREPR